MTLNGIDYSLSRETHMLIVKAMSYIKENYNTLKSMEVGRHELGDIHENAFVNVAEYDTKDNPPWESHIKYIDIQMVFEGKESFEIANIDTLTKHGEYDESKDYQDWRGEGTTSITLLPNNLLTLYPKDAHRVGLHPKCGITHIKKCIVKIPIL